MFNVDWKKPGALGVVVALAISGAGALLPAQPAMAQARALPDFTDLVEQVGPSVVNIRTLEHARPSSGVPGVDEEMQEFFRRFFGQPLPGTPRPSPRPNQPDDEQQAQPRGVGSG